MSDRQTFVVPVARPRMVEMSDDPCGNATLVFETADDADVLVVLSMVALAEFEIMLARAGQAQVKYRPKQ